MHRSPLALGLTLVLAACASPGASPPRQGGEFVQGAQPDGSNPGNFGAGGYNAATRLYDAGRYGEALPILRCAARQGPGYEVAQHLAGLAAIRLSEDEALTPDRQADYRSEGFDRLTDAAQSGWPASQAELAKLYFEIETQDARAEAAYWAQLYRGNPRDRAIGLNRIDTVTDRAIDAAVGTDGLAEAQARSAAFIAEPLIEEEIGPDCAPLLAAPAMTPRRGLGIDIRPRSGGGRGERRGYSEPEAAPSSSGAIHAETAAARAPAAN